MSEGALLAHILGGVFPISGHTQEIHWSYFKADIESHM